MAGEQKFNVPINLLGLELRNAKYHMLAAAPTGVTALHYYDTVLLTPRFYNGTEWVNLDARLATNIPISALATNPLARANHTGTQTASTISDLATVVQGYRLDQFAAPTASVSFNGQKITGLADPTNPQDAATKAYVDQASTTGNAATATKLLTARSIALTGVITASGVNFDGSANISLSTSIADGALSIAKTAGLQAALDAKQDDLGYTPVDVGGDTMLGPLILSGDATDPLGAVTKQQLENAITTAAGGFDPKDAVEYIYTTNITLSGAVATDGATPPAGTDVIVIGQTNPAENGIYTTAAGAWSRRSDAVTGKLTQGALVLVLKGTTYGGSQWYLQTDDPITVGTTGQTWVQFAVGSTYANGDGILLTGNTFSAKPGTGIVVNAGGINIDTSVVARKYSTDIGDGTTTTLTVTHNLNTQDINVIVRNKATNDIEFAGVSAPTVNTAAITFAAAPGVNAYRVTVHG